MSIRKLAGQTAVYGLSSVVARFLNYILTPYLTRIMTAPEYGVITDMYALIPFVLVLLTLGIETGYFRFAGKSTSIEENNRFFASAWGAVTAASVLFLALLTLFRNPVAGAMGYSDHVSYVLVVGAIVFFDAVASVPLSRLRQLGKAGIYVTVRLATVVVTVCTTFFFYAALPKMAANGVMTQLWSPEFGPGYAFAANLIGSIVALIILIPSVNGIRPHLEKNVLKPMLIYSLPLLVSGIAGTANEFIDRQMIKYLMPPGIAMGALGVFGAVAKLGSVQLIFTQMYRLAAEPFFLAEFRNSDFRRANAEALKYFIIASLGIFLGITLFSDAFAILIGPAFREGMYILPIILLSNILTGVVLNLSFWYKQYSQTSYAIIITGTGLLFTVVFNILLVPHLGILGAALARLICEVAMVTVSFTLNQKYCRTPYDVKRFALYAILAAAIWGASNYTADLPQYLRYIVNLTMLCGFAIFAMRKEGIKPATVIIKKRKNESQDNQPLG